MSKKAQGISINVIIVAAVALLVLVVLSVIFLGRLGIFGSQVGQCENKGGQCLDVSGSSCNQESGGDYPTAFSGWGCEFEEDTCCVSPS